MDSLLGTFHGIEYLTTHFLIGFIFFHCLILKAGGSAAESIQPNWKKNISVVVAISFFTTFVWMIMSVHDMTEVWDIKMLWMGMAHTTFAHVLCFKLLFLFSIFVTLTAVPFLKSFPYLLVFAATLLPLGNVLVSHAASSEHYSNYLIALDWLHSLCVGIWSGGLVALYVWLDKRIRINQVVNPEVSHSVVKRFSHFAMGSTFLLGLAGFILAKLNGISIFKPWETEYGRLVLLKIFIFCLALLAASINQFLHLRTWNPENELKFAKAIKREVAIEFLLITIVFIVAGYLTRTPLPGS